MTCSASVSSLEPTPLLIRQRPRRIDARGPARGPVARCHRRGDQRTSRHRQCGRIRRRHAKQNRRERSARDEARRESRARSPTTRLRLPAASPARRCPFPWPPARPVCRFPACAGGRRTTSRRRCLPLPAKWTWRRRGRGATAPTASPASTRRPRRTACGFRGTRCSARSLAAPSAATAARRLDQLSFGRTASSGYPVHARPENTGRPAARRAGPRAGCCRPRRRFPRGRRRT